MIRHSITTFTFHNVSIKTRRWGVYDHIADLFTFHNVSIKTRPQHPRIKSPLFYHILSTLSDLLKNRLGFQGSCHGNGGFTGFFGAVGPRALGLYRRSTEIRGRSWWGRLLFPRTLCPAIFPVWIWIKWRNPVLYLCTCSVLVSGFPAVHLTVRLQIRNPEYEINISCIF